MGQARYGSNMKLNIVALALTVLILAACAKPTAAPSPVPQLSTPETPRVQATPAAADPEARPTAHGDLGVIEILELCVFHERENLYRPPRIGFEVIAARGIEHATGGKNLPGRFEVQYDNVIVASQDDFTSPVS